MKKLLALVLALVMVMGLSVVSTNATFKDDDSIKYEEAVNVMSAVGVLQGDENGNFNPKAPLTREQGAKIISYMLMSGKEGGDKLTAGTAPFDDVAADRWSAGAIKYCKDIGILAGVGGNKFDPTGELTGVAFAKMLLTALGYDAEREQLTGSSWASNVITLTNKINLAEGLGSLSFTGAITREEAAKLAFNTMTREMVEYKGALTADTNGKLAAGLQPMGNTGYSYILNYAGKAASYTSNEGNYNEGVSGGLLQFCENYFPYLKVSTTADRLGRQTDYWMLADSRDDYAFDYTTDDTVATEIAGEGVLVTYTDNVADVTIGDIYTKLGLTSATTFNVIENGQNSGSIRVTKGDDTEAFANRNVPNGAGNTTRFYAGATIQIIDSNDSNGAHTNGDTTIVVAYPMLAKVTKVTPAGGGKDRTITLTVYAKNNIRANVNTANGWTTSAAKTITGVEYECESFEKGDYLLVYVSGTGLGNVTIDGATNFAGTAATFGAAIIDVAPVTKVTGKVTTVGGDNTAGDVSNTYGNRATALTVDGTKYSISAAEFNALSTSTTDPAWDSAYSFNSSYDLYLSNGYIIGVEGSGNVAAADVDDVVFVTKTTTPVTEATGTNNYVECVTIDGKIERVINKLGTNDAEGAAIARGFYLREADGGKYKFTKLYAGTGANTPTTSTGNEYANYTIAANRAAYNENGYATLVTTTLNEGAKLNLKPDTTSVTVAATNARSTAATPANTAPTKAFITEDTTILFVKSTGADLKASAAKGAIRQSIDDGSLVVASVDKDGNLIANIILVAEKTQVSATGTVVFVSGSAKGQTSIGGTKYYTYKMYDIATGDATEVPAETAPQTGFATYTVNGDGVYTFTSEDLADGDDDGQYLVNSTATLFGKTKLSTTVAGNALNAVDSSDALLKDLDDEKVSTVDELADAAAVEAYAYVKDKKIVAIFVTNDTTDPTLNTLTYTDAGTGGVTTGTLSTLNVVSGTKVSAASAAKAKTGYTFVGWYDGTGKKLYNVGDEVTVGGALTLAAVYIKSADTTTVAATKKLSDAGLTIAITDNALDNTTPVIIGATKISAKVAIAAGPLNITDTSTAVTIATGTVTPTFSDNTVFTGATTGDTITLTVTFTYADGETADYSVVLTW